MKNARYFLLVLLFAVLALSADAQNRINSVAHTPNPAYNGNAVTAIVNVNLWSSCDYLNTYYVYPGGNNILNVYLDFNTSPGLCLFIVTQTDLNIPLGNLNAGSYTVNFYDWDSQTYLTKYNFTVYGSGSGGANGCNNPIPLTCGNTYYGNNASGLYNWNSYTGALTFNNMTGPEVIHQFSLATTSVVTITLGGLTGDLDLMLHNVCSNSGIIAASGNGNNQGEQIVTTLGPGTYRVIVDGYQGTVSGYYLTLSCSAGVCGTPLTSQLNATNITQTSATLNCSVPGATTFQFRYKPASSSSWTTLTSSSSSAVTVNNLLTCSNYEFQCRVYCSNGWSTWSSSKTFATQCAPACNAPALNQIYASNITQTSVRLNCAVTGVYYYDWAYRVQGGLWVDLPATTTNFTTVTGLLPNTKYEFVVAVKCYNNIWSAWSSSSSFSTLSSFSVCDNAPTLGCGSVFTGSTVGYTNNFSSYSCVSWNESGNERVFRIVLNNYTTLTATLSNMNFNGDVFILNNCSNSSCLAYGGTSATINAAPGTYYIVVDGYNGANGNFTLSVSCSGGNIPSNDEPCGATQLTANSSCIPTSSTNVGATQTLNPSPLTVSGCSTNNMKDVWFRFVMPYTGKVYFQTVAGTLTDGVIAAYASESCSSLGNSFGCLDDYNGNLMPTGYITGPAGATYYLRFWGKNGATGTFSICIQTAATFTGEEGGNAPVLTDEAAEARSSEAPENTAAASPELKLYPVPARDHITLSLNLPEDAAIDIRLFDMTGKMVREATESQAGAGDYLKELDLNDLPKGAYIVKVKAAGRLLTGKFLKVE